MTIDERKHGDTKTDKPTETTDGAKAKAEQLTHDARTKGAHLADEAGKLAHKARDAATHPERASTRLAVIPLVLAAGLAALLVNWIRQRRRSHNRVLHQLRKWLPKR